jgi:hypothetical protein
MTARMPSPVPTAGSEIRLSVLPERVHLFDAGTGARLERETPM